MPPSASTAPRLDTIGQIAITVADLDRSVAFYGDALGMPLLFTAPPGLAFFQCGAIRIMLSRPEAGFTPGSGTVLYFKITDIEGAFAALSVRGVQFVDTPHFITKMPDHDLWMTFFKDPDGHTFGLFEEKRSAG